MSNFKKAREKAGLSQKEIAITLNVSQNAVSNWENGKTYPAGKNLIQLTELLSCSADYLLGKSENYYSMYVIDKKNIADKNPKDIIQEYIDATNLSDENQKSLLDYINLLEIREMQIRNGEIADELQAKF